MNAQTEHLTFKGVPVDGSLSEFVAKMKNVGFSYFGENDGIAIMKGDFAGYRECEIFVLPYKPTQKVSMVVVLFAAEDNWGGLERQYNSLKTMLTLKYGEPAEVVEEFQGYQPDTNNSKMHKLTMDQCAWGSLFSTQAGDIELSIAKQDYITGRVTLLYRDRINTEAVMQQAIDDL